VFFSSSNAVNHFFEQIERVPKVKYAAIGKGTSKTLEKYVTPAFIGFGNPEGVAKDFKKVIKNKRVLFPMAQDSLQTIQSFLHESQVKNLVVYKTHLIAGANVPKCDVLIFTSPSNVKGYLKNAKIYPGSKLVSIGKSTHKKLLELGYESKIAFQPNELAIVDEVLS